MAHDILESYNKVVGATLILVLIFYFGLLKWCLMFDYHPFTVEFASYMFYGMVWVLIIHVIFGVLFSIKQILSED